MSEVINFLECKELHDDWQRCEQLRSLVWCARARGNAELEREAIEQLAEIRRRYEVA
jgi:hypothetical protein